MDAENESFPHTSRHLYAVFKQAPSTLQGDYLISRYLTFNKKPEGPGIISRALRYPICDAKVIEAILRSPRCSPIMLKSGLRTELPRRLFRPLVPRWTQSRPNTRKSPYNRRNDDPLPLLEFIYSHSLIPTPNSNSWDGYPLTKAASVGFTELVRFLLENGASPAWKGGLAVKVAIKRRDLSLVKMLIEPNETAVFTAQRDESKLVADEEKTSTGNRRKRESDEQGQRQVNKRRKIEDRIVVDQDLLKVAVRCDARDIVEYFVKEKGCIPDMQTVLTMS